MALDRRSMELGRNEFVSANGDSLQLVGDANVFFAERQECLCVDIGKCKIIGSFFQRQLNI